MVFLRAELTVRGYFYLSANQRDPESEWRVRRNSPTIMKPRFTPSPEGGDRGLRTNPSGEKWWREADMPRHRWWGYLVDVAIVGILAHVEMRYGWLAFLAVLGLAVTVVVGTLTTWQWARWKMACRRRVA